LACNPLLRPILLGAWGHRLGSDSGRTTSKLEPFSEHGSVASSASATRTGASTLAAEPPPPVHAQFSCSLFSTLSFLSFSLLFLSLFFFSSLLLSLSLFPFLSSFLSLSSLSLSSPVSDRRRLVVHADADADPCNARRFSSTRTVCPPARFGGALWVLLRSGLLAGGADAGLRRLAGEDGTQPRPPAIPAVFTLTST
jgi:hypothetical protein